MNSVPAKFGATINARVLPESTPPDFSFRYVDISSVAGDGAITEPDDEVAFGEAPSRARRLAKPGSTIVSTVRTYLRAIGYVDADLARRAVFSTGFAVLDPSAAFDDRYFYYACRSEPFVEQIVARSVGVSYPAIAPNDLGSIEIPTPPLTEQRRIARFLDDQVARIDEVVHHRHAQVSTLEERRFSSLGDAVSGANLGISRFRDHDLLGPIAEGWTVAAIKHVVRRVGVGLVINPSTYVADEGVPFLLGRNVRDGWFDFTNLNRMSEIDSRQLSQSRLTTGDVVVVRAGFPGRAAVVPPELDGANCASILILRSPYRVLPQYLAAFFNGPQGRSQVELAQYGAAQEQINVGDVVDFQIPVPSIDDQRRAIERLDQELDRIDRAVALMREEVALLRDRKQSLITAAVTGAFDVTTASGRAVL